MMPVIHIDVDSLRPDHVGAYGTRATRRRTSTAPTVADYLGVERPAQ